MHSRRLSKSLIHLNWEISFFTLALVWPLTPRELSDSRLLTFLFNYCRLSFMNGPGITEMTVVNFFKLRRSAVRTYDRLTLSKYIFHDTKLSFLSWLYSVMIKYCTGLLVQGLRKMFWIRDLNANTKRFMPCRNCLKMWVESKEHVMAH